MTIAVPDVGEDANGQPHHHLVGEKPRYDDDGDDGDDGDDEDYDDDDDDGDDDHHGCRVLLRKPPLKKSKVPLKYQVRILSYSFQFLKSQLFPLILGHREIGTFLNLLCRALKG